MKKLKSILKKRPKIPRESKKNFIKRKVKFKKNDEVKEYHLTITEKYEKEVCWNKIRRLIKDR